MFNKNKTKTLSQMHSSFALAVLAGAASAHYVHHGQYNNQAYVDPWAPVVTAPTVYVTYKAEKPGYSQSGICEFIDIAGDTPTISGALRISQADGGTPSVTGTIAGTTDAVEYRIIVNQYGSLGTDCADVGDEFNPLIKKDSNGAAIAGQDETRGILPTQTSDATPEVELSSVAL